MAEADNPLSDNPTKWSNTLKQFIGQQPTKFLSMFDHFVGLALKGLNFKTWIKFKTSIDFKSCNKFTLSKINFKFDSNSQCEQEKR